MRHIVCSAVILGAVNCLVRADSNSRVTGRVVDPSDKPVSGALVLIRNVATLVDSAVTANSEGYFDISAVPIGTYRLEALAPGFSKLVIENLEVEVSKTVIRELKLTIGNSFEQLTVTAEPPLIERVTTSVGATVDRRTAQEIPLNGRFLLDLGLLVPGSVTPPQSAFSAAPIRGGGSFGIN